MKILPFVCDYQVSHKVYGWGRPYTEPFINEDNIEVARVKFYSGESYEVPTIELEYHE